jgi:hypothetical protein
MDSSPDPTPPNRQLAAAAEAGHTCTDGSALTAASDKGGAATTTPELPTALTAPLTPSAGEINGLLKCAAALIILHQLALTDALNELARHHNRSTAQQEKTQTTPASYSYRKCF